MRCHEFVNADLIAVGLSPFQPAAAEMDAGRIMVRRLLEVNGEPLPPEEERELLKGLKV
jgi:predicted ABC-type ATPase